MRRDLALWLLSAVSLALLALYFANGSGRLDFADHARGRDFVNLWTAGRLIGEDRALEVFDPAAFMAAHHRLFSPALRFHFWSYPPPALLLAAPFALTPGYFAALIAWTVFGLVVWGWSLQSSPACGGGGGEADGGGYAALRSRVTPSGPPGHLPRNRGRTHDTLLLLLCPAVAINIGLGQNGALTAALLIGGLTLLERRPVLAGALLGLLIFKPQVALLLPVMVLAGGRWRTMLGAAAAAAAVLALSTAVFGLESWRAFLEGSLPTQSAMLQRGTGPFLAMMPSAFGSGRLLGLPWTAALAVQAPFTMLGAWLVWRAWRSPGAGPLDRAAILCAATFGATPQAFNYDLIPSAFAALVLWRRSPAAFDRALALTAWILPLAMLGLGPARLPVAPLVLAALAVRLAQLAGAIPSRAARASAAGEAASHT